MRRETVQYASSRGSLEARRNSHRGIENGSLGGGGGRLRASGDNSPGWESSRKKNEGTFYHTLEKRH